MIKSGNILTWRSSQRDNVTFTQRIYLYIYRIFFQDLPHLQLLVRSPLYLAEINCCFYFLHVVCLNHTWISTFCTPETFSISLTSSIRYLLHLPSLIRSAQANEKYLLMFLFTQHYLNHKWFVYIQQIMLQSWCYVLQSIELLHKFHVCRTAIDHYTLLHCPIPHSCLKLPYLGFCITMLMNFRSIALL